MNTEKVLPAFVELLAAAEKFQTAADKLGDEGIRILSNFRYPCDDRPPKYIQVKGIRDLIKGLGTAGDCLALEEYGEPDHRHLSLILGEWEIMELLEDNNG